MWNEKKIDTKTITHLEWLSKLNIKDKEKFSEKFGSIIQYLENIQNLKIDEKNNKNKEQKNIIKNNGVKLRTLATTTPSWEKNLLKNTTHEKINNSIVIKSVLKDKK